THPRALAADRSADGDFRGERVYLVAGGGGIDERLREIGGWRALPGRQLGEPRRAGADTECKKEDRAAKARDAATRIRRHDVSLVPNGLRPFVPSWRPSLLRELLLRGLDLPVDAALVVRIAVPAQRARVGGDR